MSNLNHIPIKAALVVFLKGFLLETNYYISFLIRAKLFVFFNPPNTTLLHHFPALPYTFLDALPVYILKVNMRSEISVINESFASLKVVIGMEYLC